MKKYKLTNKISKMINSELTYKQIFDNYYHLNNILRKIIKSKSYTNDEILLKNKINDVNIFIISM